MDGEDVVGGPEAVAMAWVLAALLAERDRLKVEVAAEKLSPDVAALMRWVEESKEPANRK